MTASGQASVTTFALIELLPRAFDYRDVDQRHAALLLVTLFVTKGETLKPDDYWNYLRPRS